jgi:hypothetical protein
MDWVLPGALERVRRKLAGSADGDRQMVKILAVALTDGLPAVEAACAQALYEGVHSADVILNVLGRQRDPGPRTLVLSMISRSPLRLSANMRPTATILTPDALKLRHAPVPDCARYDQLRSDMMGALELYGMKSVYDATSRSSTILAPTRERRCGRRFGMSEPASCSY